MCNKLNSLERLALGLCVLLLLLSAGLYLYTQLYPQPGLESNPGLGRDFSLQHLEGPVSLSDFRGKGVALMFGYTSCPDVCPSGLANLAAALERLNESQQRQLQPLFISVDPERDTLEKLDLYSRYFHPQILGLTADKAELDPIIKAYGAFYRKVEMPDSALTYSVDHSAAIYLIDSRGQLTRSLSHNTPVAELSSAFQLLLKGQ